MTEVSETPVLSPGQQAFAERMECSTVMRGVDQAVCLYRIVQHETIRWIVDVEGGVLDWTVFHSGV